MLHRQADAGFGEVGVLRVRHGKTVLWREYQHTLAITHALGRPPTWSPPSATHDRPGDEVQRAGPIPI